MGTDKPVRTKFDTWLIASRPKTLPAAASGVVTGVALSVRDGNFKLLPAVAALVVALLLQVGSNLANDVFDYERGADQGDRLGPVRVTQSKMLTPLQVKTGMWLVFGLSALIGLYLVYIGGLMILLIGLAAIIAAIAYTGGPFPLGYIGLGDLFVFLFFGVAAVSGTYYIQAGIVSLEAWLMSIPIGFLIVDILVVNNLRDIDADRSVGKNTLAVRMGEQFTRIQFITLLIASYLVLPILGLFKLLPWSGMLAWLSFPLGYQAWRIVREQNGRALNAALAKTGQATLAYSVLFFVGMLLAI